MSQWVLSETWLDVAESAYLKEFDVRKERNEGAGGIVAS
jgi:hypothetical protein